MLGLRDDRRQVAPTNSWGVGVSALLVRGLRCHHLFSALYIWKQRLSEMNGLTVDLQK
jgi:hypothetical protein